MKKILLGFLLGLGLAFVIWAVNTPIKATDYSGIYEGSNQECHVEVTLDTEEAMLQWSLDLSKSPFYESFVNQEAKVFIVTQDGVSMQMIYLEDLDGNRGFRGLMRSPVASQPLEVLIKIPDDQLKIPLVAR